MHKIFVEFLALIFRPCCFGGQFLIRLKNSTNFKNYRVKSPAITTKLNFEFLVCFFIVIAGLFVVFVFFFIFL